VGIIEPGEVISGKLGRKVLSNGARMPGRVEKIAQKTKPAKFCIASEAL